LIVLGLNAFHADASAAILRDGVLIAAAEEERFRRIKHWAGFPSQAIRFCLRAAGVTLADVDHIAVNQDSRANMFGRLKYIVSNRPGLDLIASRLGNRRARSGIPQLVAEMTGLGEFKGRFHTIEHHLAHLASAFYVSPFDEAAVVSVDGFGDFASAAWGIGTSGTIKIDGKVHFPHSLGLFYQAVTQYLGFPHYGDEYKVMGLAPYGHPGHLDAMRKIVRLKPDGGFELDLAYFRHHRERISYQWDEDAPETATLFTPALEDLLGPRRTPGATLDLRHRDIARSAQGIYEEAFFHLLGTVQDECRLTDLALAGGCAMNSVANGKIRRATLFRRVYVPAAAGDAGGAIGAAYVVWHKFHSARPFRMAHAYWGPAYGHDEIAALLTEKRVSIAAAGCAIEDAADEDQLCRRIATAIADGKVVGWFQGRMEWGPRALGNRSILADPRCVDMKSILNEKIKRRESFRPFAPSALEECVADWFEEAGAVPFMSEVLYVRAGKRHLIPAVTHVDGSSRVQTVSKQANPRFYRLIDAFRELTGVPMLLNTSFNENEPVVCDPAEALDCFLRTRMDLLVLGNVMIARKAL
jgi:carbamoyltransferase